MRSIIIALVLCLAMPTLAADAGPADDTATAVAPAAAAPALDTEPAPGEILQAAGDVTKAIGDWKNVGPLGLAIALLALLTKLTKLRLFKRLLDDRGLGWVRPLIPTVLGALGALVAALQSGAHVGPALLAGVLAGLGGVGIHEVGRLASSKERARVRVDGAVIEKANAALTDAANAKEAANKVAGSIRTEIDSLKDLPEKERLAKLAALLNRA